MASVPSLRKLIDNDLCCAQWRSETDYIGRLGCTFPATSCRVFCKIGFNPTAQAALFRLCVPVALKTSDNNSKTPLYVSIEPQHVSSLRSVPLDGSEATQACVSDLLAHSQWCSSSTDIIALQFLNEPLTVIGPKDTTSIEPRSEAAGRILESLHSLSLTTNLTLYLPKTRPLVQCIDQLCTSVSNNSIRAPPSVSDIPALYHGAGGVDVSAQLRTFTPAGASHRPPAYQDITRTSEPSTTQSETDSSPAPSKADIPPSTFRRQKRKRTDQKSGSSGTADARLQGVWMRRMEQQLLDLGESVALLRDEVADLRREREMERTAPLMFPASHTIMTRSASARPEAAATRQRLDAVELHLQRMHRRLQVSERHVRKVDADCTARHDARDRGLDDRLDDFDAELDQRIADVCEEGFEALFDPRFDSKLDERLDRMRSDLEDFVRDELERADVGIRESIKEGINAAL